ncbi:MAG: carbohydrate ABC transporter substrate-binding protein [Lachnospiraceae bacterium]|nr:carbohydrate ABC transporter substrate-binding protein [Candidatus Equihabitans merdae]
MKRFAAASLAALMAVSVAGCGASGGSSEGAAESTGVSITIFNSKSEIQSQFEEKAAEYSEMTGVDVEVYYSSDTVAAHLATKYSSNDPYTISMVDAKDIYALAEEHAVDMSDEEWVANTAYAISVNDKVVGFPMCVEGRGVMYNADAIEAITGEEFDPATCATLDGFKDVISALQAGGMESPVGIMKEDWSLGAHYFQEVYEEQGDEAAVEAFVQSLYAGEADLMNNEKFNSLMDTFDVLKEANYAKDSAISAEREVSEQMLAEGEIAFMFGGNWDWSMIAEYDYSENMGMMPVPQNMNDGTNEMLVGGGSKYMFIDSSDNTSEEQVQAAKDFLNWLVFDEEGNSFLTEDCSLVPAFNNIDASALDPLSSSLKAYADNDALVPNYNYDPDDHYSIVGAAMQKYLAGEVDRAAFAAEVETYWANTTPVEH